MPAQPFHRPRYEMAGNERRTRLVVVITLVTMVAELVVGRWSGSMALWADGWHMGSHAGALGLTLFGYAYARRHATNPRFSFGVGKVFSLVGFGSAIALSLVSLQMVGESVARLFSPVHIAFDQALPVAVVGLVVNLVCAAILMKDDSRTEGGGDDSASPHHSHGHSHGHSHASDGDHNLRAAFLHVAADALTSVAAIGALLGGRALGWNALDPVMGIVGGLLVARWGIQLVRETSAVLLDERCADLHTQVLAALSAQPRTEPVSIEVWTLGPGAVACAVTVQGDHHQTTAVLDILRRVHPFAWTHCMVLPPIADAAPPAHDHDHDHDHNHDHDHDHDHARGA